MAVDKGPSNQGKSKVCPVYAVTFNEIQNVPLEHDNEPSNDIQIQRKVTSLSKLQLITFDHVLPLLSHCKGSMIVQFRRFRGQEVEFPSQIVVFQRAEKTTVRRCRFGIEGWVMQNFNSLEVRKLFTDTIKGMSWCIVVLEKDSFPVYYWFRVYITSPGHFNGSQYVFAHSATIWNQLAPPSEFQQMLTVVLVLQSKFI